MHMTEEELNTLVEAKLADRLAARIQADRAQVREDVIRGIRREAEREWYNRINARHPIETAGDPKVEAERRRQMDLRARADMEHMDRSNSRPVEGSLLEQRKRAALVPGSEGFEIRPGRSRE
jgi:hypothetical protein